MKKEGIVLKNKILLGVLIGFVAFFLWYVMLPPLNLSSPLFWTYLAILSIFAISILLYSSLLKGMVKRYVNVRTPKWVTYYIVGGCLVGLAILILNIFCSPFFNAEEYARRIVVDETHSFVQDVAPVDFSKIPLLDKASSEKLGDRKMGQATEWVSQFYVSDLYTQINYNDKILRVTPIEYAGFIKYLTNRKEGIKGYITVDSVTGEANLITMDKGMKYMPSASFFENLYRKLRISYPTTIFDDANFEIDNEGNPYWIIPTVKYKAVGLKKEINGVVILDAITGDSKKYNVEDVPSWVDHVYSADIIIEQLNHWGEYKNGFINSKFGQKNVVNTTTGYNYLVMDDDVYLYTGITSVSSDESNIGFVLVNMRTKETNFYSAPGAEEYSAMASAEGLVQEKKYVASFPLLINLNSKPTYLLSLKDAAGLVKMYAFVDVEDYQRVVVSDASLGIEAALKKYLGEVTPEVDASNVEEKEIVVKSITSAVIDSNTYYYLTDTENEQYVVSIKVAKNLLPFIKVKDKIKISFVKQEVHQIISILLIN